MMVSLIVIMSLCLILLTALLVIVILFLRRHLNIFENINFNNSTLDGNIANMRRRLSEKEISAFEDIFKDAGSLDQFQEKKENERSKGQVDENEELGV